MSLSTQRTSVNTPNLISTHNAPRNHDLSIDTEEHVRVVCDRPQDLRIAGEAGLGKGDHAAALGWLSDPEAHARSNCEHPTTPLLLDLVRTEAFKQDVRA